MNVICGRLFASSSSRLDNVSLAKRIISQTKVKDTKNAGESDNILNETKKVIASKRTTKVVTKNNFLEWVSFNSSYNSHYHYPGEKEMNPINHFFNTASVKYEWGVSAFGDIPNEHLNKLYGNTISNAGNSKQFPGRTYVPYDIVKSLPEVIFISRTNAGKSTLLNNLTTSFNQNRLDVSAKMSKSAGFTKTLNCFNIGNRFRLVDSPGYGFGSDIKQGIITMDYLKNRKELMRSYLLVPGHKGFNELDLQMVDFMVANGISFEVIFTQMDRVKDIETFRKMLDASNVRNLSTLPQLIFVNSTLSKHCRKRFGIAYLRYSLFQSCSLEPGIRPLRKK
ncbi:translation initiation/elongation factor MRX8 NDAI_0C04520 [Naumovozyma dairenensis CBS 421]|uniref:EngB-type G domain-containing protein n=1 Tax=Naumovozyma dairenensis (strain ATCC 10597 / BCRC 20456 / CBS 421 / NBRC 0211 / NRRL Y-12639) TaxID=1071378 RepID=G0W8K1_NAUDC|nr:hypothetical protein NDAI_0C04520 [Naumovozyma dairenensis CBS 421]CCD24112.1 hypothetical protein NDAI_0C04520 [Naumovozyma dairenensis CBS 421]